MLEKTQDPDNSAYRFVSLQGCNLIGQGKHSLIYLLNDKEIVKLYHDGTPLEQIELERRNGRAAFAQGISSCNTFETVETDQGYGIIFELVNGETLAEYMREHPDELESCAVRYADLLASFHAVKDTAGELPSTKDFFIESYENTPAAYYSRHDIDTLVRIINAIPDEDTYNHNDLHTQNVMINDRKELVMIDMAEITRGHPIFDLGSIYPNCRIKVM